MTTSIPSSPSDGKPAFDLNLQHGHRDLVQAVAFNTYGDRFATGSVDGRIRVFNRHKDGTWRLCDTWTAHGGEILEVSFSSTDLSLCLPCGRHKRATLELTSPCTASMASRYAISQLGRITWHRGLVPPLG